MGTIPPLEIAGAGEPTVKTKAFETPPFDPVLNTVTGTASADATSPASIVAVNCVAFTNVVVRVDPFHCTTDDDVKFEPLTVSVKGAAPALALAVDREFKTGTLFAPGA
jgi:hypothetical protein